jgi:hypothetical protein
MAPPTIGNRPRLPVLPIELQAQPLILIAIDRQWQPGILESVHEQFAFTTVTSRVALPPVSRRGAIRVAVGGSEGSRTTAHAR